MEPNFEMFSKNENKYIFQKKIILTTQKKTQFCMWQLHFS